MCAGVQVDSRDAHPLSFLLQDGRRLVHETHRENDQDSIERDWWSLQLLHRLSGTVVTPQIAPLIFANRAAPFHQGERVK